VAHAHCIPVGLLHVLDERAEEAFDGHMIMLGERAQELLDAGVRTVCKRSIAVTLQDLYGSLKRRFDSAIRDLVECTST